jgi:hypothetical protein
MSTSTPSFAGMDTLTIPAALVPHVRHSVHQQLSTACDSIREAADGHWGHTDRGAVADIPDAYRCALDHFDDERALLDILGWDHRSNGHDVDVDFVQHANVLYDAVAEEAQDLLENVIVGHDTPQEMVKAYRQLSDLRQALDARLGRIEGDPGARLLQAVGGE